MHALSKSKNWFDSVWFHIPVVSAMSGLNNHFLCTNQYYWGSLQCLTEGHCMMEVKLLNHGPLALEFCRLASATTLLTKTFFAAVKSLYIPLYGPLFVMCPLFF